MQVFARVPVRGPGRLVDDVGRDGADLDKAVVLDEDSVARQVAVDDGRLGPLKIKERKLRLCLKSDCHLRYKSMLFLQICNFTSVIKLRL